MKALGLYCGSRGAGSVGGTPSLVDFRAFEDWLGRPLAHALDFTAGNTWNDPTKGAIEDPNWWLRGWEPEPTQVTFSVAMLPGTKENPGGTLLQGANGDYNGHWTELARNFVAEGYPDAVLRVGYEFNGKWFPWFAGGQESAFIGYWRQIVKAMRAVSPKLRFEWCPSLGRCDMSNPVAAFPGDRYVNRIGTDVYDSGPEETVEARWTTYLEQPFGLRWHADFAALHHKNMSHAEWGLWNRDEPYFIEQMAAWIAGHQVVSACYFNTKASAEHHLSAFPQSQAKFKELFGA